MRPSTVPGRVSHAAPQISQAASAAATAKLNEKKKEFEAVSALERSSALLLQRIEGLANDCDIMADAGKVHGQILAQWPSMFRILSMFLSNQTSEADDTDQGLNGEQSTSGQRLVRICIEELQGASPAAHAS